MNINIKIYIPVYSNLDFLSFTSTIQKLEEEKVSLLTENENLKKKLAFYIEIVHHATCTNFILQKSKTFLCQFLGNH